MIKILVNDGIHPDGKLLLEEAGFQVDTDKISQEDLMTRLNDYDAICVRSATKVRKELIDASPNLKAICRGGVGLDNIDVAYAKEKGIAVYNTPAASSQAVAELAFGHMFSLARSLYLANREMPVEGDTAFKKLKKNYSKGMQLRGKTLGIIGFGRIGQETARIGAAIGMKVMPVDPFIKTSTIGINVYDNEQIDLQLKLPVYDMDEMLANADFISMHIPFTGAAVIGAAEFAKMKDGVIFINCARGGTSDEAALIEALDSGKVAAAGLDVFETEPTPSKAILNHPKISLSPHIGASTKEAQQNIGLELAEKLMAHFA